MVRYFLTDLLGNPIYSFAQRLRRNAHHNRNHQRLSVQLLQASARSVTASAAWNPETPATNTVPTTTVENHSDFVTTTLVCMIRNRAWDDALKRVASHPHEVHVTDAHTGNTVLHVACRLNPPATIVQALATPATARHANHEGATPLHIAASHRCSGPAVQSLLDACRHQQEGSQQVNGTNDSSLDKGNKHTSPTADLSRMGRAPIHYACMSFRGLEIDAFRLLLDATLQEGNVWVWDRQQYDEDDDLFYSSVGGLDDTASCKIIETPNEDDHGELEHTKDEDTECNPFEHEHDMNMYVQQSDDLTIDDSKAAEEQRHPAIKVLVNVMGMKDATGQTPLGLLFRRYRERVRCVINTVDRLRREQQDHPELVAALRVHADLGELWEKARWIVARLTEERLQREEEEGYRASQKSGHDDVHVNDISPSNNNTESHTHRRRALEELQPPRHPDATSRRATYFGSTASSSFYDTSKFAEPQSPAEVAVAQEAASWAVEQHQHPRGGVGSGAVYDDAVPLAELLPLAPNVSTEYTSGERTTTGRHFRIVHASVGLTGYGCPPELIRLAISIHPQQVTEMDEDGNLPLHIAVTAASYLATAHMAAGRDDSFPPSIIAAAGFGANNGDDHSVMSDAAMSFFSSATVSQTTNPFDKVIKILLQQYPDAARMPQGKTGRLPLVLAVESKRRTWADGLRTLLNAYPPAMHNKKVFEPELYPNVLALVARNSSSCAAFDFAACRDILDLLPIGDRGGGGGGGSSSSYNQANTTFGDSAVLTGLSNLYIPMAGGNAHHPHRSKRAIRQEVCSRTTLFELLRTKPEWLTRAFDGDSLSA